MTLFSSPQTPKSSKYVCVISKIEAPEVAQLELSRSAPEARFVGVAKTLQNKQKSIKMTLFSPPKTPKSSKYVSFINKIEAPEVAQLEPSRSAPEARFVGVAKTLQNKRKSIEMTFVSPPKTPK